jgi:hypothetical protein
MFRGSVISPPTDDRREKRGCTSGDLEMRGKVCGWGRGDESMVRGNMIGRFPAADLSPGDRDCRTVIELKVWPVNENGSRRTYRDNTIRLHH